VICRKGDAVGPAVVGCFLRPASRFMPGARVHMVNLVHLVKNSVNLGKFKKPLRQ
jgi:hypothetical protein